jgi:cell division initiation protein
MSLNAIDIEQKTFRVALRGYAEEEVDAFLDEIIATVRSYEQQLKDAHDRIAGLESRLTDSQETEDRIKRTLVIAQKTADEVVREARFEAQQILSEARLDASEIETEQARKRERLGGEVETLQKVVGELHAHVRGLTERLIGQVEETQSAMADVVPEEFVAPVQEAPAPAEEYTQLPEEYAQAPEGYAQPAEEYAQPAEEYAQPAEHHVHEAADTSIDLDEGSADEFDDDDEDEDIEEPGEVYLGSDRRPWERYGD